MTLFLIGLGIGLFVCVAGVWVACGERAGRLTQHANDLRWAWNAADSIAVDVAMLKHQLQEERSEHETWCAWMASENARLTRERAELRQALEGTGEYAIRKRTWLALDGALKALHADPDPHCMGCGESIGPKDSLCFICGIDDELVLEPTVQA